MIKFVFLNNVSSLLNLLHLVLVVFQQNIIGEAFFVFLCCIPMSYVHSTCEACSHVSISLIALSGSVSPRLTPNCSPICPKMCTVYPDHMHLTAFYPESSSEHIISVVFISISRETERWCSESVRRSKPAPLELFRRFSASSRTLEQQSLREMGALHFFVGSNHRLGSTLTYSIEQQQVSFLVIYVTDIV